MKKLVMMMLGIQFHVIANAQERQDSTREMDPVVVSATRQKISLSRLPFSIAILGKKDMQRQVSRTVPEALYGVPGVFIQKTNHAGGSPFLRGLTGNQALILVDGIRLNNAIFRYGPNQYMTLIEPAIVEKIEVVKGSGSVQYGSDAMTGVINIQTTSLSFRSKAEWNESLLIRQTESGMEMTVRPELKYEGKRFSFVAGASHKNFGDLKGGDTTGFQRPSGYGEKSADFKLKFDLGRQWEMVASGQWLQQLDIPVYHKYKLENFALNTSDPIGRGFQYVQLDKQFKHAFFRRLNLFVSGQQISETRLLRKNGSAVTRTEKDRVSTLSAGADLETKVNRIWSFNSGVEWYADRLGSSRIDRNGESGLSTSLRALYPDQSRYVNLAIYNLHHIQIGKWNMETGLRYNAYRATVSDNSIGTVNLKPSALVSQLGINRQLAKDFFAYLNISEGFRAPNLDDLGTLGIVDFRYEVPAYDLKPERSLNKELGFKFASKHWQGKVSVFKTNLNGLITRIATGEVITGYNVYKKVNVDKAFIRGWEIEGAVSLSKNLKLSASATNLFGQNVTKDQPLRRIPPFYARVVLEKYMKSFVTGIIYDHASPQRRLEAGDKADNRIPLGGTPGFNIVQVYGGYQSQKLTFRLHWNNIFNADYRMHGSGINGMGSAVSAMLLVHLKQGYDKGKR